MGNVACAQSTSTQIDPNTLTGIMPYNTYGGVRENINLATGDLNLRLPLIHLPGRNGLDYSLDLIYDSKQWKLNNYYDPQSGITVLEWDMDPTSGWRLNTPVLITNVTTVTEKNPATCQGDFMVILADGSKHGFFNPVLPGSGVRTNCYVIEAGKKVQQTGDDILQGGTNDASYLWIDISNQSDVIVYEPNGERLHFPGIGSPGGQSTEIQADRIEDSNGNEITISTGTTTDTVSRSISQTTTTGQNTATTTLTYNDSNGASQTVTLNHNRVTLVATFVNPTSVGSIEATNTASASIEELASVVLPTGRSYSFQYDNGAATYGELTKIIYPTGGYTRYDFAAFTADQPFYSQGLYVAADFREVTARHVCRDSAGGCTSSTEDSTTFTPTVNQNITNNQYMDRTDPLGNLTHYQFSFGPGAVLGPRASQRELSRSIYIASSTILRTITTDYDNLLSDGAPTDASRPIRKTTTLDDVSPNFVTKTEWDYGAAADDVTAEREYDYGSGSAPTTPLRQTISTFLATNPVNSVNYTASPVYILDRKLTEVTEDGSDNIFAQKQYEYDNYGTISASGAVQLDSALGTGYTTRGNVTKSQVWRNSDGAWLATTKTYDDAGNVLSVTAPSNSSYDSYTRTTSFSYADSWANSTCAPSGGSAAAYITKVTNAKNQATNYTYNSCAGTMASVTDANSQPTGFSFDMVGRLLQTSYPDKGLTSYCYSDLASGSCYSTGQIFLTRTDKITPSGVIKSSKALVDGVGNVVQRQLTTDPDAPNGIDYTDIGYDGLERKVSVSNPYRSASSSTDGTTLYTYDPLNRVTVVQQPDTSQMTTSYAGNQTTVRSANLRARACGNRRVPSFASTDQQRKPADSTAGNGASLPSHLSAMRPCVLG